MKHTYTIFTLGCGSLRHLGDQVPEIQQMLPVVNQRKEHRRWPLMELYFPLNCVGVEDRMGSGVPTI